MFSVLEIYKWIVVDVSLKPNIVYSQCDLAQLI